MVVVVLIINHIIWPGLRVDVSMSTDGTAGLSCGMPYLWPVVGDERIGGPRKAPLRGRKKQS